MPNLVNSVDILAVRHVKQGIEAERFRAVQPLVQVTYITLQLIRVMVDGRKLEAVLPAYCVRRAVELLLLVGSLSFGQIFLWIC